jgi:hypothetical protein
MGGILVVPGFGLGITLHSIVQFGYFRRHLTEIRQPHRASLRKQWLSVVDR